MPENCFRREAIALSTPEMSWFNLLMAAKTELFDVPIAEVRLEIAQQQLEIS